jgi:methionine-rich copper-binding protein CopC
MKKGKIMKMTMKNSIVLSLAMALTMPVFAQTTATPHVGKRQAAQQKRIAEGVQSGDLTAKETVRLEMREAKIQADKKAAKADGVVTGAERAKLQSEQNRVSKKIYNKKHN